MTSTTDDPQLSLFQRAEGVSLAEELVEAAQLGDRRLTQFKKANSVIAVYPINGQYSLGMRKMFNALLALAHVYFKSKPVTYLAELVAADQAVRLEASVRDVKELIGWGSSNNTDALYQTVKALSRLTVRWDAWSETGRQKWFDEAHLISKIGISEDRKFIRMAWLPELAALLFDPSRPYTPLDLELTRQFASKHTLALFENVYRYRNMPTKATPWRTPSEWRLIIVGTDSLSYKDYREFKRNALSPALKELRETPQCPIDIEMEEQRGMHNKIKALRFTIRQRQQRSLEMDLPAGDDRRVFDDMLKLGVRQETAQELLATYDRTVLTRELDYTRAFMQRNDTQNPAGLFIKAVRERYNAEVEAHEAMTQEKLHVAREHEFQAQLESNWRNFRRSEAQAWWQQREEDTRESLRRIFLEQHASPTVKRSYGKGGERNKLYLVGFLNWLADQPNVLHSAEAQDLASYSRLLMSAPDEPAEALAET